MKNELTLNSHGVHLFVRYEEETSKRGGKISIQQQPRSKRAYDDSNNCKKCCLVQIK